MFNLNLVAWILYYISFGSGVISWVLWIVAAFSTSILWGILAVFLPIFNIIFLFLHWDKAKTAFLIGLLAFATGFGSIYFAAKSQGSCLQQMKKDYQQYVARRSCNFRRLCQLRESKQIARQQPAPSTAVPQSGTQPEMHKMSTIFEAASYNDVEAVKLFIRDGADINAVSSDGWTALMNATAFGAKETVEFLLAHGADAEIKTSSGETARDLALQNKRSDIAELLHPQSETSEM